MALGWLPLTSICLVCLALLREGLAEPNQLGLTRLDMPVAELPHDLVDYRILHISDMHVSRRGRREECLIDLCQVPADLIVFTGDYVARKASAVGVCVEVVRDLLAGRPAIGVLGNNDFSPEIPLGALVRALGDCGLRILRNEAVRVSHRGSDFVVGGLDDPVWRLDDSKATWRETGGDDGTSFRVLLAHSPHPFYRPDGSGANLLLVGHTHGGQVCLPGIGSLYPKTRHVTKYTSGTYRKVGTVMHVNRGVGTNRLPVRLFCRPEVILYTLKSL